jgi:glycosyl transferase family 25
MHSTSPSFPIFVIAFANDDHRRAMMTRRLEALGLAFSFIDAIDGRALPEAERLAEEDPARADWIGHHLRPGAFGCLLSHRKAWQALLDSGAELGLVLEDDAVLGAALPDILDRLSQLADRLDLVNLHHFSGRPMEPALALSDQHSLTVTRYNEIGAEACILSATAARQLLARSLPARFEVDLLINRWWEHGLQVLTLSPPVADQDDTPSQIGYQQAPPPITGDGPSHQLKRRWNRLADSYRKRRGFARHKAAILTRLAR